MMEIEGTIRTRHAEPSPVAGALAPDNLVAMETRATGEEVITTIRGDRIGSIIASVDDYLTNLVVAEEICQSLAPSPGIVPGTGAGDREKRENSPDSDESA